MKKIFPKISVAQWMITMLCLVCNMITPQSIMAQSAGPDQIVCQDGGGQYPYTYFQMAATGTGTWTVLGNNPVALTTNTPTYVGAYFTNNGEAPAGVYGFVWTTGSGPDTVYVTVKPAPRRPVLVATGNCFNRDSLLLHVTAGTDSIKWWQGWSNIETTAASDTVHKIWTGGPFPYHVVTEIGSNGCESVFSDTVDVTDSTPVIRINTGTMCAGVSDTLYTVLTLGSANTSYQWYINNVPMGINSPTYISNTLANGDAVKVVVNNHTTCSVPDTGYAQYTLAVSALPPAPVLSLAGGSCAGSDSLILNEHGWEKLISWYSGNNLVATTNFGVSTVASNGVNFGGNALNEVPYPTGVARDNAGYIYVGDYYNARVMKFPPNGNTQTNGIIIAGGNGNGTAANQFNQNWGICLDNAGNLYVADENNNRIQKFPVGSNSATNGVTVAGGNGAGSGATQLRSPTNVFVDALGYLYVTDGGNNRVQKFPPNSTSSTSGTTVAGGNGSGSAANQFNIPYGLCTDGAGNLYVSDLNNNRVQKFPAGSNSTTNATTVAGGNGQGTAANQLNTPCGITLDIQGNLYVIDRSNERVQRFPPGSISSTNGVTVAGGNSYGNHANQLYSSMSLVVDSADNIYIADYGNARIQKWPQPAIDTVYHPVTAGTYTATYQAFTGCTSPVSNAVVVSSCSGAAGPDQTVCQYSNTYGSSTNLTMAATGTGTWSALSTNPDTLSFLHATSPTTIIYGTLLPGVYSFVWTTGSGPDTIKVTVNPAPPKPVLAQSSNCLVTDTLIVHNASGTDTIEWWISNAVFLTTPASDTFYRAALASAIPGFTYGIAVNTISAQGCISRWSDTIAIPDTIPTVAIALYDSICVGALDTLLAMPTNRGLSPSYQWYLNNIATGSNSPFFAGNFITGDSVKVVMTSSLACAYPATASNSIKLKANPAPPAPTLIAEGSNCLGRDSLLITGEGFPYGLNWYLGGNIVRNNPFPARTVAGGAGSGAALNQLSVAWTVCTDRNGYIYVADQYNYRVLKFPPGSTAGSYGEVITPFLLPYGISVDTAGYLYVASQNGNVVLKFPPGSNSTTHGVIVAGNGTSGSAANEFAGPSGIFINSAGELYVADESNNRIQKFPAGSDSSTHGVTVAANQLFHPISVTGDAAGNIYVDNQNNYRVLKFPANSNATTTGTVVAGGNGQGTAANQFGSYIYGLVSDAAGNLYVSDALNSRVQKFPVGSNSATNGITVAGGLTPGVLPNQLTYPSGLYLDANNDLFIVDELRIQEWDGFSIDSFYTPVTAGNYTATYIAADGCKSPVSNTVTVSACHSIDTLTICRGSADTLRPYLAAGSYSTYIWTPGTGLSDPHSLNPVASPLVTTTYILSTADTGVGGLIHDTVLVVVDTLCHGFVWPGDADNNGIVDNTDLLPIGLTYNLNGPARSQQDMLWYAHSSTLWTDTIAGGINDVYSDCNGDGTVNITDVNAILNNYSLTHAKAGDLSQNRSGNPVLKLIITPDTLLNGDGVVCRIVLGDSNNVMANNVYGIAFTLNYNPLVVDSNNIQMTFPDCWLATQSQHISLAKNDYDGGAIYAGLSRIDRASRNGAGEIALVNMVITTDNIDGKDLSYYIAQFSLSNIKMIDQFGDTLPVNRQGDSAIIGFYPTGIIDNQQEAVAIKLFPDPANNSAHIYSIGGKMSNIILTDVLGRQINSYEMNASSFELLTSDIRPGVYFAQIEIGNHIVVKKFLVQH